MHSTDDPYAMRLLQRAAFMGHPIKQHMSVPRDAAYLAYGAVNVHPSTYWAIRYGRTPLYTRHMVGVRELERDRRKHPSDKNEGRETWLALTK